MIFLLNMAMFGLCAWSHSLRGDDLMILLRSSPIPIDWGRLTSQNL